MSILLLGGTADARHLCDALITHQIPVIYSIAGLVRRPSLDCPVVVGGFRQFGGLSQYLVEQGIELILDVTHPYAQKMSDQAVRSANACHIPVWRFQRPAWVETQKDHWLGYRDFDGLVQQLSSFRRPLLSAGQLSETQAGEINALSALEKIYWRTAVAPKFSLQGMQKWQWAKAIGPFSYEDEKSLIQSQAIDVIVSKNSGGRSTYAKIQVAQDLNLSVIMLERPKLLAANQVFTSLEECVSAIMQINELPR